MKRYILLFVLFLIGFGYFLKKDSISNFINSNTKNESVFAPTSEDFEFKAKVQYVSGEAWKLISDRKTEIKEGDILSEGDQVITGPNTTLVLVFDEGSVLRIGEDTDSRLSLLKTDEILINQTKGKLFARVNKDEKHQFNIKTGSVLVKSLGTAFSVENKDEIKVKVFDSKVSVNKDNGDKKEVSVDQEWNDKKDIVESLKKEEVTADKFLTWSLEQEELKLANEIKEEKIETKKVEEIKNTSESNSKIILKGKQVSNGIYVEWTVSNLSTENGFKILVGKEPNPTFPDNGFVYVNEPNARHYTLSKNDGNSYNIRVCNYLGGKCGTYSNNISVTAPDGDNDDSDSSSGDVTALKMIATKKEGNVVVNWKVEGYSEKGFKLLWSRNENPTYPLRKDDHYIYYNDPKANKGTVDDLDDGKKYYFRVCEYLGGKCGKYSNQVSVEM